MNEKDKQELLRQLDKCKYNISIFTTYGDEAFCGFVCTFDCASCRKGAMATLDMIINMVKEKM